MPNNKPTREEIIRKHEEDYKTMESTEEISMGIYQKAGGYVLPNGMGL